MTWELVSVVRNWICLRRDIEGLEYFGLGLIWGKSLAGIFVILRRSIAAPSSFSLNFRFAMLFSIFVMLSALYLGCSAAVLEEEYVSTLFMATSKGWFLVVFRNWRGTIRFNLMLV